MDFVFKIMNLLMVCKWRHGGHVGGQEQKHFSPLGNELYFDANLAQKCLLYWPPTWPPCHVVANQELVPRAPGTKTSTNIVAMGLFCTRFAPYLYSTKCRWIIYIVAATRFVALCCRSNIFLFAGTLFYNKNLSEIFSNSAKKSSPSKNHRNKIKLNYFLSSSLRDRPIVESAQ